MKPVEIEFLMKDSLTPGLTRSAEAVKSYSRQTADQLSEVTESLRLQRDHVARLEKELAALADATGLKDHSRLEALKKELDDERQGLTKLIEMESQLRNASSYSGESLRSQLRNLTQEIATLKIAYARLSEEERMAAQGKALQQHIDDLTEKAGVLRDAMADSSAAINNAASDTRGFDQLAGALQLAIDGFGLATAGAEMFGVSQEDLVAAQTKLQAALVASNALSSVQNNLQKQSALMQGIAIIQTKAAAQAENIRSAAQGRGVVATKAATVAQAAFNSVANANPYVILTLSCLTLVGALYAYTKGSKAAKEAEDERLANMETIKRRQQEFQQAVVDSAAQQIASFLKLKRSWENLGDSFDKKKKFIADTKEEWRQLGKEIDNVNDMERLFRDQTDDMLAAIVLRAEIKAYETKIQQVADQMVAEIEKNKSLTFDEVHAGPVSGAGQGFGSSGRYDFQSLTPDEIKAAGSHLTSWRSPDGASHGADIDDEGARIINAMRQKAAELDALSRQEDARRKAVETIGGYVDEMGALSGKFEEIMASIPGKDVDPEKSEKSDRPDRPEKSDADDRIDREQRAADELLRLRRKNEQAQISQLADGAEKRRRQIALDYERQIAEIEAQETRWAQAQGGALTKAQAAALADARGLATAAMHGAIRQVEDDEVAKNREKLNGLLDQYKDYDQRRREIEADYKADMATLSDELGRLEAEGLDASALKGAMAAREEAFRASVTALEGELLKSSDFYDRLFGAVAERGYRVLKDFYGQAKDTLDNAMVDGNGVEISIPVKDADGKFVKQAVRITVDEYRRMLKQVQEIRKQLEKDNPFAAFRASWSELTKATREGGDVAGALNDLNSKGKELTGTIKGWGDSLGSVFGDNFKRSMGEILTFCDGAMDMGSGIARIWSGDIVGGITSSLSGLGAIVSLFKSWKEKAEEMKREWYIAEIETNRSLRERREAYAANRSEISAIIKDVEQLNWLIERGFARPSTVSVWDAESAALGEYTESLRRESAVYDELWSKLQASEGHYEWGNSLNGGSASWSLKGYSADMIELWYNQGKLSDEAKAYYEAWVESGKSVDDLIDKIEECKGSMREMVMGATFDSFLSNSASALKKMRGDISELGRFTEDTLAEAIMNGFMYRDLAKVLEPLYNELTDAFIDNRADAAYLDDWRRRYEEIMMAAGDRLEAIAGAAGVDLDGGSGSSQTGKAGAYTAMSQDQGTKLEGIGTSILLHTASIDEKMDDVSARMGDAQECLRKIEQNTAQSAEKLEQIADDIAVIKRDGIRTR